MILSSGGTIGDPVKRIGDGDMATRSGDTSRMACANAAGLQRSRPEVG